MSIKVVPVENRHNYKCAIFDMDGTLANTGKITVPACIQASHEYGITPPSENEILGTIGIGGLDFYRKLFPLLDEEKILAIAERIFALEKEISRELGSDLLFPNVAGLLAGLKAAGVNMAIASTGETEHVESVLTVTGIKHYFANIKCNTNDKIGQVRELKEIYQDYDMWMIGDKPKDSDAAKANSIPSIGVGYGFSSQDELSGFDVIVNSAADIPGILEVK
ncbi:MAG: HAD family hydrolase [Defluviitaleaceae bacterium]|nr:HAD family hydrolase [Defluviitaleaceae bacterium]